MEGCKNDNRRAIRSLIDLYAILRRPDDVERIWKSCTEPMLDDYLAAIGAWGKLRHIEQVEETFEALRKTSPKLTSKYFNAMLNVYAENKLIPRGKTFLERMCSAGCQCSPLTWDALVNLYVNSDEVEKADSFLQKVAEQNPDRNTLFCSYVNLLKAYAEKGDIHSAEKIFDTLKKVRYPERTLPYGFLLKAYVNAEVPAYGFRERMRADNVHHGKTVKEQLVHLDNLQKAGDPEMIE
jgi:pentatricopeptide repeat protein